MLKAYMLNPVLNFLNQSYCESSSFLLKETTIKLKNTFPFSTGITPIMLVCRSFAKLIMESLFQSRVVTAPI